MSRLERAIITTGGTREPIDDVRFITNFSTGRFGMAIAESFAARGYQVKVLCPPDIDRTLGLDADIEHEVFTSTRSLQEAMAHQPGPALIFHAAAVSDFTPKEPFSGKITSDQDEINITLVRTPKILDELRGNFGVESFIVGFKLLSNSSRQELVQAAMAQNKRAHLNLTVANDLAELHDGRHPVILVTAEGGAINLDGKRDEVANNILEFVRKRAEVTWYHSVESPNLADGSPEQQGEFADLLHFAQDTNLLYDSSGNVSMRLGNDLLRVTPRQVDKSTTLPQEACTARVDHQTNTVEYKGQIKSSIDTAVNDTLYQAFPGVQAMLHFHTPWGFSPNITEFPYPCGVKEEAQEILRVLGNHQREAFSVELLHHGFLVGLPEGGLDKLNEQWQHVKGEYNQHLVAVDLEDVYQTAKLSPIFSDTDIVGILASEPEGVAVYLTEEARGKGVGRKIVSQIVDRQIPVRTVEECGVVGFYKRVGFSETRDPDSRFITLNPPTPKRTDPLFGRINEWRIP